MSKLNIQKVIESIGLSSKEVKTYLLSEIEEFLNAKNTLDQENELHDIIFSLRNLVYAHTGKHLKVKEEIINKKIKKRLSTFGTISRKEPTFSHNSIKKVPIGVVHIAIGNYKQPWSHFDPFKNGTEAEIAMLTDIEFKKEKNYANHLIITFDNVDETEFSFLTSSWNRFEKNTILCRVPDFMYSEAKKKKSFDESKYALSLQIYSALKALHLKENCIFHFHSWESSLSISSELFKELIKGKKKFFSPYLTISRLRDFLLNSNLKSLATLDFEELDSAYKLELDIMRFCDKTIVESENDKRFYEKNGIKNIIKCSYSENKKYVVEKYSIDGEKANFVSGGRPVYEKGFLELLREVPDLIKYFKKNKKKFHLKIFCKEYSRSTGDLKKSGYIKEIEHLIKELDIADNVEILDKVSINQLREEIKSSQGLIIPSLYDPYCLMPHYSIYEDKVCFTSKYTGISENIRSKEFIFDPMIRGSLLNSIKSWNESPKDFILHNSNFNYTNLYKNGNW